MKEAGMLPRDAPDTIAEEGSEEEEEGVAIVEVTTEEALLAVAPVDHLIQQKKKEVTRSKRNSEMRGLGGGREVGEVEDVEVATVTIIANVSAVNLVMTTHPKMIKTAIKIVTTVETVDPEGFVKGRDAHHRAALMMKIVEMIIKMTEIGATIEIAVTTGIVETTEIAVTTGIVATTEIDEMIEIVVRTGIAVMTEIEGMIAREIEEEMSGKGEMIEDTRMITSKKEKDAVPDQRGDSDRALDETKPKMRKKAAILVVSKMQVIRLRSRSDIWQRAGLVSRTTISLPLSIYYYYSLDLSDIFNLFQIYS